MSDKIAIIGLGYVGIPLAVEFGKVATIGFDIVILSELMSLKKGIDRTLEMSSDDLASATHLSYTISVEDLSDCNIYIITGSYSYKQ